MGFAIFPSNLVFEGECELDDTLPPLTRGHGGMEAGHPVPPHPRKHSGVEACHPVHTLPRRQGWMERLQSPRVLRRSNMEIVPTWRSLMPNLLLLAYQLGSRWAP